jgi:hypothetical protein
MVTKDYDISKYKFADIISSVFNVNNLASLHKDRSDLLPDGKLVFENESQTDFHSLFYSKMNNSELQDLEASFHLFIANEVRPLFDQEILHQYMPSFRVHLPKDQAIHKWHYDSDDDHKHPDWEINFQVALTDMFETQATWIESIPGLGDFSPMNLRYGQYSIFDGNRCTHGNKRNSTDSTRVSFDFRVIPSDRYESNFKSSVTTNKKFAEGDYYRRVT